MRSGAQFQPGERSSCLGCHESPQRASAAAVRPMAMLRRPSRMQCDVDGTNPFSYPRLVQPVLDKYCVACHQKNAAKAPALDRRPVEFKPGWRPATYYASYLSLVPKYATADYGARGWNDRSSTKPLPASSGLRPEALRAAAERALRR